MRKCFLLLFILATMISTLPSPAEAVNYVKIGDDAAGTSYYMDVDSIKTHNEKNSGWVRVIPKGKGTKLYGKDVAYSKQLWEADTKEKKLCITSFVDYDKGDKVVWKFTPTKPEVIDILPNTLGDAVYRTLTKHK